MFNLFSDPNNVNTLATNVSLSILFSNMWFTAPFTNLQWFRGTSKSLAVAGHAEIHGLWPGDVLWRFLNFAPVGSYHCLLCLWQEGFKYLCQVETKSINP